jgi:imidazole glycerol-phosphate synthase subunit HisH
MKKIVILDYDMGNLHSVAKALKFVAGGKTQIIISDKHKDIIAADKVVFPGQGAAKDCMRKIAEHNLQNEINYCIKNKPFLGICMGMQVLFSNSYENNNTSLLDIYNGEVLAFKGNIKKGYKIPHMGWNNVKQTKKHPLWQNIEDNTRFYFVHSYFVKPKDESLTVGISSYDIDFCANFAEDNIFSCQFHPEKSADNGLQLLHNFINWNI